MFCVECGKEIPDSVKFCPHCGASQMEKVVEEKPAKAKPKKKTPPKKGKRYYSKLKIPELKEILKEKKLPISGRKDEMIERLTDPNWREKQKIPWLDRQDEFGQYVNRGPSGLSYLRDLLKNNQKKLSGEERAYLEIMLMGGAFVLGVIMAYIGFFNKADCGGRLDIECHEEWDWLVVLGLGIALIGPWLVNITFDSIFGYIKK